MRFSDCGNFLHGTRISGGEGEPVFLHIGPDISPIPPELPSSNGPHSNLTDTMSSAIANQHLETAGKHHGIGKSDLHVSVIPKFSHFQGQLQVSALAQDNDRGSVLVQTMRADGKMIEETVTRLPKSSTLEKSYPTLVPSGSHKNIRLVLNMAIQDTYSMNEKADFHFPTVVDREKASIPTTIYCSGRSLESSNKGTKRHIGFSTNELSSRTMDVKRQKG
jgi:hypothetical protein